MSAIRPVSPVPTPPSSSGRLFSNLSWYRWDRQPAAISTLQAPLFLSSPNRMIASMDSCLASSINPQVLMITTTAERGSDVKENPLWARAPSMTSLSTWFLEHPRFTSPTVTVGASCGDVVNVNKDMVVSVGDRHRGVNTGLTEGPRF